MAPGSNMAPLIIGLAVVAIGMAIGAAAGYAINPARDLGPRLAAAVTGWGGDAFNDQRGDFYAWVPIIGPFIGGVLGAYIYDFFIGNFLPTAEGEVGEVVEDPGTGRRVDTSRPETST
jgi:glycerol uptake facilitator protein